MPVVANVMPADVNTFHEGMYEAGVKHPNATKTMGPSTVDGLTKISSTKLKTGRESATLRSPGSIVKFYLTA